MNRNIIEELTKEMDELYKKGDKLANILAEDELLDKSKFGKPMLALMKCQLNLIGSYIETLRFRIELLSDD